MKVEELILALAAGLIVGAALVLIERTFPTSGIRRI